MRWHRGRKNPPEDYLGNIIELGDIFFNGNPTVIGRVIKIKNTSIMLETGADYENCSTTMNIKSPDKGLCLNKVNLEKLA